jgi:hypothetical protein
MNNECPPNPNISVHRALLLASKQLVQAVDLSLPAGGFMDNIEKEKNRFLSLRGTVQHTANPQIWWREHATEFPLLARYFRAHCAFQATSTASERVFNVEGLVFTKQR